MENDNNQAILIEEAQPQRQSSLPGNQRNFAELNDYLN